MTTITREQLKTLFKKVKHLRLPKDLESEDFSKLKYFAWMDESDDVYYLLVELDDKLEGIRGEVNRSQPRIMMKHLCTICKQQREFSDVMLFTAKTRKLPKGVEYRTAGVYICTDFRQCNQEMKNSEEIERFARTIIEG